MPQHCYFVSFIYFDTKHLRSNKLSHVSVALMEGDKGADNSVQAMRLISSYGYYSHRIPKAAATTHLDNFLKKIANVSFRIHDFYAEMKQESLTDLDFGFGVKGGPVVEITLAEKERIEKNIQFILENEKKFFANADAKACGEMDALNMADAKKDQAMLQDKKNLAREQYYHSVLRCADHFSQHAESQSDLLVDQVALNSGLISKRRFQQEVIRNITGIEPFAFSLNPQGSTCKTLGFNLVINSLDDSHSGKIRKLYLANLLGESFYTRAIPRLTKNISRMIFNSIQAKYACLPNKVPIPARKWDEEGLSCHLIAYEKNTYLDLQGVERRIQDIQHMQSFFVLLENLMHLKRLLNDFCTSTITYQNYINLIDEGIIRIVDGAKSMSQIIEDYHATLKKLAAFDCFERIQKEILDKHKLIETGVWVEIKRLATMRKQAQKFSLLKEIIKPHWFAFFKRTIENSSMLPSEPKPIIKP